MNVNVNVNAHVNGLQLQFDSYLIFRLGEALLRLLPLEEVAEPPSAAEDAAVVFLTEDGGIPEGGGEEATLVEADGEPSGAVSLAAVEPQ